MAVPKEQKQKIARPLTGEEVVISGMSGVFPKSKSILEFMENLYNKVDMVTDEDPRWIFNHPEVPKHLGKVDRMGKFDAQFFRVHYKQACTMEPMNRKLLEHAYSAIYDSGINPLQLRGHKVGVFIGSTFSESEKIVIYENIQRNGLGITGCNKAMYANRISYWIDGKGPSYALDMACASSMACLEHAFRSISTGQCDAAIVGGCNLCMHPNVTLNLKRAGFLCLDGKTKCFDKNGDGYVRSDAISVLFLQKAKNAKRIYSEVYHAQESYSLRADAEFLPSRKSKDIENFLKDFYSNIDVSPSDVEYVEANGAAIAEADANELEAIGRVFGKDKPVKVGCVKSNMGHSEPASGVCSLAKVCLAYHKGELPANLHYSEPLDIPSVRDGKVEVLQDHAPFNRSFTALNSFSYSGANIHVLLKGRYKPKDTEKYKSSIPHLVLASGRQEPCVNRILNELKSKPVDPEQIGMLHTIHENDIPGHMCRGFTILDINNNKETICLSQEVEYYSGTSRPLWFVYSGMGSQWAGMGAKLMQIPTFAAAIKRCHNVLEPKGIDIVRILSDPDKTIYDNILNSFVGIAAVQIGLTDILSEMGIVPDNIIGHSVGELGCAYADGCFTAEEMILAAYSRGLVSVQTPFILGSMAAVGLSYKTVLGLCPPEIEVACHNSSESSTISGPADIMKTFVAELTSRGVFAKEVPCSNIAYHSQYIAEAGPGLLKYLSEVIKTPKLRSKKWVSTSVPQEKWEESMAKYSSAEYHTNNLLNSVLFEETARLIPTNALLIEIAPHGLLQAILKRSHGECTHVPLTRRGHSNPVQFFLEAIGKLYQEGLNPKVASLYPTIQYPVSTETPFLSQLVEWEHSEDWPQAKYNKKDRVTAAARKFVMSIHDDDYKYFEGHVRNGATVFPEAAILVLIWETLAMQNDKDFKKLSVVFRDVQFHSEAHIMAEVPLRFSIMIHKGDTKFEVSHDGIKIASGFISEMKGSKHIFRPLHDEQEDNDNKLLTSTDIYTILGTKGYSYKNEFQSIQSTNINRNKAILKPIDDWVILLDAIIQLNAFANDYDGVSKPKLIKKLKINMDEHNKAIQSDEKQEMLFAHLNNVYGITRCAGVELDNIVFNDIPKVDEEPEILESRSFIPHFLNGDIDMETALLVNLQIIADNVAAKKIKIAEIGTDIANSIKGVVDKITGVNFDISSIQEYDLKLVSETNVLVVTDVLRDDKKINNLLNVLPDCTFVLAVENDTSRVLPPLDMFNVISVMTVRKRILQLLNKADIVSKENITYIPITHDSKFSWLSQVQTELLKTRRVVLVSQRQPYCGLLGLVKKLSKEFTNKIRLLIIDDYLAPSFNPDIKVFKEQLMKSLIINVLNKGKWGGYYYLPSKKTTNLVNFNLTNTTPGDIDSLSWMEISTVASNNNLVQVYYAGPSLRDAHKAVGKVETNNRYFGMDFSGINNEGEKVMGLIAEGAIATVVEANADLMWPVPDHWSLEEAATVPLPYVHAYYCLGIKYPIVKGTSVFINCGAGALGQAVISICLAAECTVYTTVSNIEKKQFLLRLFPKLEGKNIACSRDENSHNMVIMNSNGKRCNTVINGLSGPLRESAMKCVGFAGIFIDISELDKADNKDFGMFYLFEERNYMSLNLSNIFRPENERERKALQFMVSEGIANGIVRPLSRVVYSPPDVTKAFRLLSSGKHRGRALIRMRDPAASSHGLNVKPRMIYSSKGTYIVVCKENNLGIELVDRLIKQGVTKVVINVKSKSLGGYFQYKLASWTKQKVLFKMLSDDLQTEKGCINLLQESIKLSPVQGIFIVQNCGGHVTQNLEQNDFIEEFNDTALVVANLDLTSRHLCPELSNFVVVSGSSQNLPGEYATSVSEKICQSRNDVGLPALIYKFMVDQTVPSAFTALETSLKLEYNNVLSLNVANTCSYHFLDKISRIVGTDKIEDIPEQITLSDLGINEVNIEEIRTAIMEVYQFNYSSDKVKQMTMACLKTLGEIVTQKSKFDSGLEAFYSFIDDDECMATEPMVSMPTKLSNATEKEEELDPKATYLMLLPGFEGHHQIFIPICERLKVQAMTLQLGPDLTNEDIPQMAVNIMKFMKKRFELKSKFYLLGYSFGVTVALELAALIEKEGHVGIVFCLDSSPDALRVQLDAYIGNLSDTQLQDTIVQHMYRLMTGKESKELKEDLESLGNWSQKVEACVNRLRGLVNYSHQYKRSVLETAYKRIKMIREYRPDFVLESELVLMKGIPHPKAEKLTKDYNLSKYSKKEVKIFNLEFDHALAPNDGRVSNIVNRLFEPHVLEAFKKQNLCETYLADPFKIL